MACPHGRRKQFAYALLQAKIKEILSSGMSSTGCSFAYAELCMVLHVFVFLREVAFYMHCWAQACLLCLLHASIAHACRHMVWPMFSKMQHFVVMPACTPLFESKKKAANATDNVDNDRRLACCRATPDVSSSSSFPSATVFHPSLSAYLPCQCHAMSPCHAMPCCCLCCLLLLSMHAMPGCQVIGR